MMDERLRLHVLFFGPAREQAGAAREQVIVPAGTTLAELRASLRPRLGPLAERTALAVNGEIVRDDRSLATGDEVAVLPPVSGG